MRILKMCSRTLCRRRILLISTDHHSRRPRTLDLGLQVGSEGGVARTLFHIDYFLFANPQRPSYSPRLEPMKSRETLDPMPVADRYRVIVRRSKYAKARDRNTRRARYPAQRTLIMMLFPRSFSTSFTNSASIASILTTRVKKLTRREASSRRRTRTRALLGSSSQRGRPRRRTANTARGRTCRCREREPE
jgi:hypothetical protein